MPPKMIARPRIEGVELTTACRAIGCSVGGRVGRLDVPIAAEPRLPAFRR